MPIAERDAVAELAIFSGRPAFAEPLHVGRPNIGNRARLLERINDALDRRWLTNNGPFVQELELRIAEFVGVRHCIALCNATVALEIVTRALGMQGEVIVPSFTFAATAHALQWQAITPVFCDVDPATHNLDPAMVEAMITPRTTGIMGVHVWGRGCAVEELTAIAERRNLALIFDAAHAFGCTYGGVPIGGFGAAEVFSFHATKFLNSLEGGAIVTNDDALAEKIRLMRNFGFADYDDVSYVGTNGKMNEFSAAMGLTSLEMFDELVEVNERNYKAYVESLAEVPGVQVVRYNPAERLNYQYVVLEIEQATAGLSRDDLRDVLWAEQILARRYFYPGCHRMEPYRSYFPHAGLLLPHTEALTERVLSLPSGTAVGPAEIARCCRIMQLAVEHSDVVVKQLRCAAEQVG